jgi:hypothetical protein
MRRFAYKLALRNNFWQFATTVFGCPRLKYRMVPFVLGSRASNNKLKILSTIDILDFQIDIG